MRGLDWNLDWKLPEGAAWDWFIATPGAILLIIAIGLAARWLASRTIDRLIERTISSIDDARIKADKAPANPVASDRHRQRARTMGSLLKSIVTGLILAVVVMMVLSKVGIDIAPIIASAGIVGVALGFGAQNLVKDFLSGVFMILEDQYGVGDTVDLGEASGTVEAVGLRVTRLRDVNGTVWYVRNGEVLRVGNSSQNWARTVLDITVGYESNLDQVEAMLNEEAHALYLDSRFKGVVLEDPEVWGVERFDKDGAVIRVVLKTAPSKQWEIARALRQRIKSRFDAEGIRIPTSFATDTSGQA